MSAKLRLAGPVAGLFALTLMASPASANLLTNGDFESNLDGWSKNAPDINANSSQQNPPHVTGKSADLAKGTSGTPDTIWQVINTVAGQVYDISFGYFGGTFRSTDNGFEARAVDVTTNAVTSLLLLSGVDTSVVGSFTGQFTATGNQTRIEFLGYDSTTAGGAGWRVDNVEVTAVPGPIAGAGLPVLAALVGYGWRRRRAR